MNKQIVVSVFFFFLFIGHTQCTEWTSTFRIGTVTDLTKLISPSMDLSGFEKRNLTLGGLINKRTQSAYGFRFGLDYSIYRYSRSIDTSYVEADDIRVIAGMDFVAYDEWCRIIVGLELFTGSLGKINYGANREIEFINQETDSIELITRRETGTISNKLYYGIGAIVEIEKDIGSKFKIGFNTSLNLISKSQDYINIIDTKAFSYGGSTATYDKRKVFFDPSFKIYLRF